MSGLTRAANGDSLDLSGANLTYVVLVGGDRARRARLRRRAAQQRARGRPGHREDAGDRRRRAGGRLGVPHPAVQDAGLFVVLALVLLFLLPADTASIRIGRSVFFLVGARLLGVHRLRRHVAGHPRQRARRRGRRHENGARRGDAHRVPHRWRRRHVHRRPRPARRRVGRADLQGRRPDGARGLRLRRRAARDVHAGRRRHLHQGRRRRRRPRRQGRAGHPRGRPAQRRDDRRQRRRQRR